VRAVMTSRTRGGGINRLAVLIGCSEFHFWDLLYVWTLVLRWHARNAPKLP